MGQCDLPVTIRGAAYRVALLFLRSNSVNYTFRLKRCATHDGNICRSSPKSRSRPPCPLTPRISRPGPSLPTDTQKRKGPSPGDESMAGAFVGRAFIRRRLSDPRELCSVRPSELGRGRIDSMAAARPPHHDLVDDFLSLNHFCKQYAPEGFLVHRRFPESHHSYCGRRRKGAASRW
jgi:hypothetical protein